MLESFPGEITVSRKENDVYSDSDRVMCSMELDPFLEIKILELLRMYKLLQKVSTDIHTFIEI